MSGRPVATEPHAGHPRGPRRHARPAPARRVGVDRREPVPGPVGDAAVPAGHRQGALAGERLARPHASPALPVPAGPAAGDRPLAARRGPRRPPAYVADAIEAAPTAMRVAGLRPDRGFLELGQGEWEGLHQDEIARRYPDVLSGWRRRPWEVWAPGGESLASVQARVRPALADRPRAARPRLPARHARPPAGRRLRGRGRAGRRSRGRSSSGHDGVFKVTLLTLFGLPLTHFWMFTMALTGITVVELRGGRPGAARGEPHRAPRAAARRAGASAAAERAGAVRARSRPSRGRRSAPAAARPAEHEPEQRDPEPAGRRRAPRRAVPRRASRRRTRSRPWRSPTVSMSRSATGHELAQR